jgi:hypothetical protein
LSSFYDVDFKKEDCIIIPAEGGTYHFVINAVETKTSFSSVLRRFEYRVMIEETIIDQQLVDIWILNAHIQVGDQWEIEFSVPENNTSVDRTVRVETIIERDYRFNEDIIEFDPGDNTWQTVWEAVQLSN